MIDPHNTGTRVRRAREAAGLRQKDLGTRTDIAAGTLSMIENGAQVPDNYALNALAQVLDCTPDYLQRERGPWATSKPWLRAYADASKRTVDLYIADTTIAAEAILELKLKVREDLLPTFLGNVEDDDDIEGFAEVVRSIAGIDDGTPVGNATRAAERLGVIVLPMQAELGRHLGMSMRVGDLPLMRISRTSEDPAHAVPGDRQRFTVCHELGHLLLHAGQEPPSSSGQAAEIERQANRFASAFLAPADAVLADLKSLGNRPTLNTLATLKEKWGIAIKALVVRFAQLGIIEPDQARSLYKQISARKWNKNEPVPVGNESAQWLALALKKHSSPSPDIFGAASKGAGLGTAFFARWTDWSVTPFDGPHGTLLDFPDPSESDTENDEPAEIYRLPVR